MLLISIVQTADTDSKKDGNKKMKKYRYFMSGMFCPTDGEEYEINIPSPFLHDSKEEAMKDGNFGYRFLLLDNQTGPVIVVYENERFKVVKENGLKHLNHRVEGKVLEVYTFEKFKQEQGSILMLRSEKKGFGYIDSATDFLATDKTFKDIFPNMQERKLYYIDNEAYWIEEIEN